MSSYIYQLSTAVKDEIYVSSGGSAVTGLTNGSFTKLLFKDGAVASETITIAEINSGTAPGVYSVSFTPTVGVGDYVFLVYVTASPGVKFTNNFPVRAALPVATEIADVVLEELVSDHEAVTGSLAAFVRIIKNYVRNKLVLTDPSTGTYTLYKDDEIATFETGTFSSTTRDPT